MGHRPDAPGGTPGGWGLPATRTDRKRARLPGHRPGVPGASARPGGSQKSSVIFSKRGRTQTDADERERAQTQKHKLQRTPWGGGKRRGVENLTNDTPPKKGLWTPPRTVRFPPPSGASGLFFLYKNPRWSRPEALLEGSKNFRESAFSGTFPPPPTRFAPRHITAQFKRLQRSAKERKSRAPRCGSGPKCVLDSPPPPPPQGNWRTLPSSHSPSLSTLPTLPYLYHPPPQLFFREKQRGGGNSGEGKAYHKAPPQKRFLDRPPH